MKLLEEMSVLFVFQKDMTHKFLILLVLSSFLLPARSSPWL